MGIPPEAVPGRASPRTILLVEDEAIVAADEARLLRDEGYAVLVAADGKKAIETVKARPDAIDLILMDIDLGKGMDGARAAREILKEHDIPVLFLSSHTERAIVEKTEKISSYGYVVKDSGVTVLSASIKMALKLHEAHRELERHEEALRESREQFSNAFEHAAIGMALVSPKGRWLKVNRSLCGILGYSDEELLGKTFQEITHPEDVEASLAFFRRVITGDLSTYQLTKRYLHKGGAVIWAQLTVSSVRGKEGLPLYVIAQIQDITERRRAEESLREMSEMFHRFMEHNPIYVFIKDADIRPVYLSRNYEKMLGRPLSELLGKSMDELFPSELSKKMIADDQRILQEGRPIDNIIEVLEGRTYSTIKFPILIGGVPRYLAGYTVDVTDRETAEEALREGEARYRSLFEHMEEGAALCRMLFDDRGRPQDFIYLQVNPAFERLTGLKDVEGRRVTEVIPGIKEQTPELFQAYGRVASTGRPEKFEIDFTPLGAWLSISVYSPGKGEFVAVFDNITERKRAEEALHQSVRQKEILMKELQHRVKNSLSVVSGLLSLEMENLTEPRSREIFGDTRSRIRSIASLYERLYVAADIDRVDLGSYIKDLAESLVRTYASDAGNVRLTTRLDDVRLDTKRAVPLGLILNELVTNALKHAYPGGTRGEIRVTLERSSDRLCLGVADYGAGLPRDFVPATSGGMGWSLVRMLAEEIDARLTVENEGGCRVYIGFDLKEA